MNAQTQKSSIQGLAGQIEMALDLPAEPSKGVVVIAHPHPLFGGTMDNKVVQTLARAFTQCGWTAVRFNFRGVGASAGTHDNGNGELDDLLAVVRYAAPSGRLALAGFSFGAFVTSNAFAQLHAEREIESLVLVGVAASRFPVLPIPAEAHAKTLVIHGEQDDTVPLASVMDWARPQILPVTVVPGVGHFFHGQLPLLKSLVVRHLG
ncbi:MAG: alpha/beta fold hydrolase [Polaromonas sp.]|nr:alpha/beta fold hydrolase [Polaromonas sp.]